MFLHTTAFFYIISFFNTKTRRNVIISFEFAAIVALILSLQIYEVFIDDANDHDHKSNESIVEKNVIKNVTTTFIDSNGVSYTVVDQ